MQVARLKPLRGYIKWRKGEDNVPTCPEVEDSPEKFGVILDVVLRDQRLRSPEERGTPYQVVGEVTAHQAKDG